MNVGSPQYDSSVPAIEGLPMKPVSRKSVVGVITIHLKQLKTGSSSQFFFFEPVHELFMNCSKGVQI